MLDHLTYICLALCTIIEPVFEKKVSKCFRKIFKLEKKKKRKLIMESKEKLLDEPATKKLKGMSRSASRKFELTPIGGLNAGE